MKNLLLGLILLAVPQNPPTLPLGAAAPDFDLAGADGKRHALKDFAGARLLLVLFNTNHCPTSQKYEERIRKLVADYAGKGVAVVVISPSDPLAVRLDELGYTDLTDTFEDMKIRARDRGYNYPYLYDGDRQDVSRAYGPAATPHAFLFDGARKLRYVGRIDDNDREDLVKSHDLRNALDALLAGRPVPVESTRARGCSTKWSSKRESVKEFMEKLAAETVALEPADAAALRALRRNESGKVRLIHVWSGASEVLPGLVTMNRMYRRRNFEFVTVALRPEGKREEALAFLRSNQASNRNLLFADLEAVRETLDPAWDGALPFTLLVGPVNDVLYRKAGPVDDLAVKRTIVRHLTDPRPR